MIEAERVLLRHALRDPFNHRFVFLSDRWDWFCKYLFMSGLQLMTCLTKFQLFGFFSAAYLCTVSSTLITTSCQHQLVSLIGPVLLKYITSYFNSDTNKKEMFMLGSLNNFFYTAALQIQKIAVIILEWIPLFLFITGGKDHRWSSDRLLRQMYFYKRTNSIILNVCSFAYIISALFSLCHCLLVVGRSE